jgi:pimeloyl-ACP methyl ester carboxylesterase
MRLSTRKPKPRRVALIGLAALIGLKLYTDHRVRRAEARYPPLGEFVTVDGVALHYVERGSGPPVILIHGDGGSVYDWTMSIFDRVAQDYRAIAFDRPGLGYSERPADGASPFTQARLIHEAAEALDAEKPIIVGHSRGGNVALAYALSYPDNIAGVVALAAAPYGGKISCYNRLLALPVLGPLLAHTVYVPFGQGAVRAGLNTAFAPEATAPPDYVDAYAAYELRPRQLLAHAADQVQGRAGTERMIPRYDELQAPLIIIHGTADRNVPIKQARRLHQVTPNATLIEIPGASHELMFLHPDDVMEGINLVR